MPRSGSICFTTPCVSPTFGFLLFDPPCVAPLPHDLSANHSPPVGEHHLNLAQLQLHSMLPSFEGRRQVNRLFRWRSCLPSVEFRGGDAINWRGDAVNAAPPASLGDDRICRQRTSGYSPARQYMMGETLCTLVAKQQLNPTSNCPPGALGSLPHQGFIAIASL